MIADERLLLALGGLLALAVAVLLTWSLAQRRVRELEQENTRLRAGLEAERRLARRLETSTARDRQALSDHFAALSGAALRRNSGTFLKLARESLKQHHVRAQADLAEREKSIDALVGPIRDALDKTEQQIRQIEKERREAYGALTRHLESLAETQSQLHGETRNLVQALRRPEVRGQWGELTLRRLVELAGMVAHCDFVEQPRVAGDEGNRRPDMVVHLPEGRQIVVDAKTPLDAYLNAMELQGGEQRAAFAAHARNLRTRIRELADKQYWSQFPDTPEFVVMFIPGEQFLSAALDVDRSLQESALAQRVVLATPNNFVALLKTIAFGWRQQSITENAEQIRRLGEDLHGRLATFFDHLTRSGKALNNAVESYNRAVGSLERQVLPGARRFTELGIQAKKTLEAPGEATARAREAQDLPAADASLVGDSRAGTGTTPPAATDTTDEAAAGTPAGERSPR